MFIIARALASVYNEGLYAEMYSINLAAVSTCDYAFELNNLIHTLHVDMKNWRQIWSNTIGDSLTHTEGIWLWLCWNSLFLHWDDKKHLSLDIINHCIYVFHWRRSSEVLEKSVHMLI